MIGFALALMLTPMAESSADVARCVADNGEREVSALLASLPGSTEETRLGKRLMPLFAACDGNKEKAIGSIAWRERAEVANAAVLNRIEAGSATVSTAAASTTGWRVEVSAKAVAGKDYGAMDLGMRMLGDCVVAAQPEAALNLVRSAEGSAAESAAIAQLSPVLGPCVVSGQNLRVKRQDLRLVVAEPLYHLIVR